MAYDFPDNPTENQEYTPADGSTYIFKNPRWDVKEVDYVAKTGDTMTGPLFLSGAPTADLHAATKLYIDGKQVDWTQIINEPTSFVPSAHNHPTSEITGLDTALGLLAPKATPIFTGTISGTASPLTGITTIAMGGALTGATTIGASGIITGSGFTGSTTTLNVASSTTGTINIQPGGAGVATGAIQVTTTTLGFFGKTAVARQTYATPTGTISRATYATASVTLPVLAGVVMALVTDLEALGLLA